MQQFLQAPACRTHAGLDSADGQLQALCQLAIAIAVETVQTKHKALVRRQTAEQLFDKQRVIVCDRDVHTPLSSAVGCSRSPSRR